MDAQRQFFDARAHDWEARCYPPETRARLQAFLPSWQVETGAHVLDLGTGPGVLLPYLAAYGVRVVAVDISMAMLQQAARKSMAFELVQADAQRLPFVDATFHQVICFAAFPHFPDKAQAAQECARVLRPGGTLVIAHLLSREELARHHGHHGAVAADVLPEAGAMEAMLAAAGLRLIELVDHPGRYLARARRESEPSCPS
jgi:ubiquinone/menaquinone biosynthesis C-methylase UbiE